MTEPSRPTRRTPRPRRRHAALASRVLVTGLAASSSVGLVGALALGAPTAADPPPVVTADQVPAPPTSAAPETTVDDPPMVTAPPDTTPPTTTSGAS